MEREANKFVVPCIFCTHATFLLRKINSIKGGRERKRGQANGGGRNGEGGERELSPVPKLLASVAFNIPTTLSINIDTCRERESMIEKHRKKAREMESG